MDIKLQIILGYILADLLTAFSHWIEDTYIDYNSKIPFVKELAKDNELHHYFPRSIVGRSYFENIKAPLIIIIPIILFIYFYNSKILFDHPYFYSSLFLFSIIANIIHRWCHMRECELPKIPILLQNIGIFGSHSVHRSHHVEDSSKNYGIMFYYTNIILDKINFWRILENLIYILTGIKPNRRGKFDDYKKIHTHLHKNTKSECPKVPTKDDIDMLINILDKHMKN